MSEKKTLNIDPNMFSFTGGNSTRKKRNSSNNPIKIKTPTQKKQNDTLKKKSILKMIRQHQEDRYKNMFETKTEISTSKPAVDSFNKDFQEAKLFLENIAEKTKQTNKLKNYTINNHPHTLPKSITNFQPITALAENMINSIQTTNLNNPIKLAAPSYGCLKNGTLPTYKNHMNTTQKNYPTIIGGNSNISMQNPVINSSMQNNIVSNEMSNVINQNGGTNTLAAADIMKTKINNSIERINTLNESAAKLKEMKKAMRPKQKKQKKTLRRTFKIGKSKVFPRVSVLVSNKTIRNNMTTKAQLLKQTPMPEVKKYLIKRGFIKVGSTAPNDVLRQMYENSMMVCGELQNHNTDNLLYNFLNGEDS